MTPENGNEPPGGGGDRIAVVLAGGGARGAYEAGALSVLLPELAAAGQRVSVIVGTSVGALNGAWLAANIHRPIRDLVADATGLWRNLRWEEVVRPLWSPKTLIPFARYSLEVLGGRVRVEALLDDAPLAKTIRQYLDVAQLQSNVASGTLHAAAVVATAARTGRSVVFHSGGGSIPHDDLRGIDYVQVGIRAEHVRASAAIPVVFRPVEVTTPSTWSGWYVDGGTRLNTPIKPALALGADRVVVVALNSTGPRTAVPPGDEPPDIFQGGGLLAQAILADPLMHDVRTLATINALAETAQDPHHRVIPYMLVAPTVGDRIGEIASDIYREHYATHRRLLTSVGALGRLVRADAGPANGELLSYLFFAPEFAAALLREGAADARAWLKQQHDDGIWQRRPLAGPNAAPPAAQGGSGQEA